MVPELSCWGWGAGSLGGEQQEDRKPWRPTLHSCTLRSRFPQATFGQHKEPPCAIPSPFRTRNQDQS